MLNNIRGDRLNGFFRGVVLKHLEHGKCKIFIYGVYDDALIEYPDALPDAEPATPIFGGNYLNNGVFSYPCLNSYVWCFFANENQNYPVYFAGIPGGSESKGEYGIVKPNDNTHPNPHIHRINTEHANFNINEYGQLSVHINNNDVDINCNMYAKDSIISYDISGPSGQSKFSMDGSGNISVETTKSTYIKSPNITISGSTVTVMGNNLTLSGGSVNIIGAQTINEQAPAGDCVLTNISLVNHIHNGICPVCGAHPTTPPIP